MASQMFSALLYFERIRSGLTVAAPNLNIALYEFCIAHRNDRGPEAAYNSRYTVTQCSGNLDIGIVCDHMMLAARELEIGSVMVGLFDPAVITKEFI